MLRPQEASHLSCYGRRSPRALEIAISDYSFALVDEGSLATTASPDLKIVLRVLLLRLVCFPKLALPFAICICDIRSAFLLVCAVAGIPECVRISLRLEGALLSLVAYA